MTLPATYSHAENATFLQGVAGTLAGIDGQTENAERLLDMAVREAEQDPAYVAHVNDRVEKAMANPGKFHSVEEARAIVRSWRKQA